MDEFNVVCHMRTDRNSPYAFFLYTSFNGHTNVINSEIYINKVWIIVFKTCINKDWIIIFNNLKQNPVALPYESLVQTHPLMVFSWKKQLQYPVFHTSGDKPEVLLYCHWWPHVGIEVCPHVAIKFHMNRKLVT
jgi:hypothetical protein